MHSNALKAKLRAGQRVIGVLVMTPDPDLVELFGHPGYDFVFLDAQHGGIALSAATGGQRGQRTAQGLHAGRVLLARAPGGREPGRARRSIALIRDRLDGISEGDREWLFRKTAEQVFFG